MSGSPTRSRERPQGGKPANPPLPVRRVIALNRSEFSSRRSDVIGMALLAAGVLLGGVTYLGWSGGIAGRGAIDAARFTFGAVANLLPVLVVGAGAVVLAPKLRPAKPRAASGVACLIDAVILMIAAGTASSRGATSPGCWQPAVFERHAGALGQAELWLAARLLGGVGADILAVFLLLAAVILTTRTTARDVLVSMHARLARTTSGAERPGEELEAAADLPGSEPVSHDSTALDYASYGPSAEWRDPSAGTEPPPTDAAAPRSGSTRLECKPAAHGDGGGETRTTSREPPFIEQPVRETTRQRRSGGADFAARWELPSTRLLTRSTGEDAKPDTAGQEETARALVQTLGHFRIQARLLGRVTGPHITRYELRLAPGTKIAKIAHLADDIAYALAATDIRILAPIPGQHAVGVEVPNARRQIVHLGDVLHDPPPDRSPLAVWLGKDIGGRPVRADLAKMPHLLVAGTTGAGKSACLNTMLCSILLTATPDEVRFVLVDPKQVELNHYDAIPHLLAPLITSPRIAANALQNLIGEMDQRYDVMSLARTRSLPELNRVRAERGEPSLPYILCVIDEFADLMMVSSAEVEDAIIRLAQKARAVGIHLLLATQSPRADVITGMIKANVPSRIAFSVPSQTDSRVILDQNGAESLLGQGDMLFSPLGAKVQRLQGAYIDERQIAEITNVWRRQGAPQLHDELLAEVETEQPPDGQSGQGAPGDDWDPRLEEAIALVAHMGTASTSMLQRRLRLGYTRAGRLLDMLERLGVISGYEGSKPRKLLISEPEIPRVLSRLREDDRRAKGAL